MQTIKIYTKNVYGNKLMYVANNHQRYLLHMLTGSKTINQTQIETLEQLGFKVLIYDSEALALA